MRRVHALRRAEPRGRSVTTLIPLLIIVARTAEGGDGQSLADQIIERFDLSGATAASVQRALPATGTVRDSLSVLSVVILVVSALSFTRALQRMYARAWNLEAHGLRDAHWGLAWLALFSLYAILHPGLHGHVPGSFGLAASLAGGTVFWLHLRELALRRGAGAHRLRRDRRDALADDSPLAAVGLAVDERAHGDELESHPLDRAQDARQHRGIEPVARDRGLTVLRTECQGGERRGHGTAYVAAHDDLIGAPRGHHRS